MRNDTAQPIIETLLDHLDRHQSWKTVGCTVPASNYTDPERLRLERARLFTTTPVLAALTPDLPQPGSWVTRDRLGLPVVLTRDTEGQVHAFANVCAHRGSQVAPDGRDCTRRLSCPYHAWTYELDGTLVALPDAVSFPDVAVPGPGLRELPSHEADGLIWVVPSLDATDVVWPDVGAIADDFVAFDLVGHRHWRSHRFDLALNWKLVIDTFLEGYHFASLHRNTVGPIFIPNLSQAEAFGPHVRHVIPRRTLATLQDEPAEKWDILPHSVIVYILFPNTVFVMQSDHIETWRLSPDPDDPGRSICDLDFYVPDVEPTESSERHWEKNWKLTIDTVIGEDFFAMAGVQRGLASGAIDELRVGANETAMRLFHTALADAMG